MSQRQRTGSEDHGSGVHDRALAFARQHGLTVQPVPTSSDMVMVELRKGELLIGVAFKNTPQPDGRWEWFVTARDPRTCEELWNERFDYNMWFDFFGDASEDLSDEEWAERVDEHLIAFLDAALTHEVRLARVREKPLLRLFGWRWPNRERTELQLLIGGEWKAWDKPPWASVREGADLPRGWRVLSQEHTRGHELELGRELPVGHQLHGRAFEIVAACKGCDDDLVRTSEGSWMRVHLTWSSKRESDANWPSVGPVAESWEDAVADAERHAETHGSYDQRFLE